MTRSILALAGVLGLAGWTYADADFSTPPGSFEPVSGPVAAWVQEVIDGDTIAVRARIWLGQDVTTRVRLSGVDAPELKAHCEEERRLAQAARDFVRARVLETRINLVDIHYDKYGRRVLARVVTAAGEDLGEGLIRHGLGRPYGGGTRNGWCGGKSP